MLHQKFQADIVKEAGIICVVITSARRIILPSLPSSTQSRTPKRESATDISLPHFHILRIILLLLDPALLVEMSQPHRSWNSHGKSGNPNQDERNWTPWSGAKTQSWGQKNNYGNMNTWENCGNTASDNCGNTYNVNYGDTTSYDQRGMNAYDQRGTTFIKTGNISSGGTATTGNVSANGKSNATSGKASAGGGNITIGGRG